MIRKLFNWKNDKYPENYRKYLDSLQMDLHQDFHKSRFVVLDTETTGLNKKEDQIITFGAVTIQNNNILLSESYYAEFNYDDRSKRNAIPIHGILPSGNTTLNTCDKFSEILELLSNCVVVAHHASFDIAMLNKSLDACGIPYLKNKYIDTAELAQRVMLGPHPSSYQNHNIDLSLDGLCRQFDIFTRDRHNAIGDAYLTAILFLKLCHLLRVKGVTKLKDLLYK